MGRGCVGQTMVEIMKIMRPPSKGPMDALPHSVPLTLQQATADPCLHWRLLDTNSQASLGQSFVGSLLLSPGSWCAQGFVCALQESVFPLLHKFWWLYGGVNGDLLQKGLCHIQVCCTQGPCPCDSPLLTHISTGDTQTLKGRSGSVSMGFLGPGAHNVLFESSECLWRVWGLFLNVILPLLPSFLCFSFALGCGVSFFSCEL